MNISMPYNVGERVEVRLESDAWESQGWFAGIISRVDPYSEHRHFYWVELDKEVRLASGARTRLVSVFNLRNLRKP